MVAAHAFRLLPGEDLKHAIVAYAQRAGLQAAAVVTVVGSVEALRLRLAGVGTPEDAHEHVLARDGKHEIVSVVGTVGKDGCCHLHVSAADAEGLVVGGHLLSGCVVYTTAEVVLLECTDHTFARETDAATGFAALVVSRRAASRAECRQPSGESRPEEVLDEPAGKLRRKQRRIQLRKELALAQQERGWFWWVDGLVDLVAPVSAGSSTPSSTEGDAGSSASVDDASAAAPTPEDKTERTTAV